MKKKKILFLCINNFDLYKVFQEGFEKHANYEVTTILYTGEEYKYKNIKQRIINFFSKKISGINKKEIWLGKDYFKNINSSEKFDYAITIAPDVFHESVLKHIKNISKKSIVYYWDGFDHFPEYKNTLQYFDEHFTFDPEDAKTYDLKRITNFYFSEGRNHHPSTDLFFLSSYDNRYPIIKKIVETIENQNDKFKIKVLQLSQSNQVLDFECNSIAFINKPISFKETKALMMDTKIVLDIQKDIQRGLTFRVFEAMGYGKKLITTNADIANYDFYNPNNIFIWKEDTTTIPEAFLNTPYEELPLEIYQKYSRENWVKTILALPHIA